MLKWIHRMEELDFNALMEIYAEACIENGQEFWPDLPAEEQIRHSQEHFRSYLQEQFFAKPEAVYAVWLVEGRYVTALRLEPKWDGLLMEALETRPDARCQGHASALITAVQENFRTFPPIASPTTKIYSHVRKTNLASLRTHERCGFQRHKDHILRYDGTTSDQFYTMLWEG
ncbi:MAG: GNAT family N-acetyltransferase [Lachnospiraceae bacterium]|nr:GNAT family N-acetyltransferase [Lachnospiraceae bacterium]